MIKFILEEVIWTEVVYILEVMFVEAVLARLQHLCLSLYLRVHIHTSVLALVSSPRSSRALAPPQIPGVLKTVPCVHTWCISQTLAHFLDILGLSRQDGVCWLQAGISAPAEAEGNSQGCRG